MAWEIDTDRIEAWLLSLDDPSYLQVRAALTRLVEDGPHLGRPLVDTIKASRHKNMKELRPGSSGQSELRILFAFNPQRKGIMLLAGDKSTKWQQWYKQAIPLADDLFDEHLAQLKKGQNNG